MVVLRVVQRDSAVMKNSILAENHVVQTHDVLVQRAGNHDGLERRARLHHVADDAVAERVGRRGAGIVRIKIRQRRHRQDFPRARAA